MAVPNLYLTVYFINIEVYYSLRKNWANYTWTREENQSTLCDRWYVIVTKLFIDWLTNGSVFRDVRIKTTLSSIWYGLCVNSGERWGTGKFCRWKRLPKRRKVVYLEQELTVLKYAQQSFRYKRLAGRHNWFWRRHSVGSGQRFGWYFFALSAETTRTVIIIRNPRSYQQFLHPSTEKGCSYTLFKK